MLVDTTEYLAEPLGPAATAHLRVFPVSARRASRSCPDVDCGH
jgi:hypothetical protein